MSLTHYCSISKEKKTRKGLFANALTLVPVCEDWRCSSGRCVFFTGSSSASRTGCAFVYVGFASTNFVNHSATTAS
jgi:hypothetical protein